MRPALQVLERYDGARTWEESLSCASWSMARSADDRSRSCPPNNHAMCTTGFRFLLRFQLQKTREALWTKLFFLQSFFRSRRGAALAEGRHHAGQPGAPLGATFVLLDRRRPLLRPRSRPFLRAPACERMLVPPGVRNRWCRLRSGVSG